MKKSLLFVLIALVVLAVPAFAFEPNPGNRAYPIVGKDLISGENFELEAYRGKWVFLEFWASW